VGPGVAVTVRPYDPARDAEPFRACLVEQQEYHRALEAFWPAGPAILDEYERHLHGLCAKNDGRILVAHHEGSLVGFACVLAAAANDAPDDPGPFAFLSEIYVQPSFRGRGAGTALMAEAEGFVRSRGAKELRLAVLERNDAARAVYRARGFRDYVRILIKTL
jgi:ribosomal protein S18 acetylase RimI-like enzyme